MKTAGPNLMLPRGTVDTHFHMFGPATHYPYAESRSYTPADAGIDAYMLMAARLGISRSVIVQPSPYGTDNQRVLDGMAQSPIPMRGVVAVKADVTDAELIKMHSAGVRAIRINLVFDANAAVKTAIIMAPRLRELGWHIQFLVDVSVWDDMVVTVAQLGVPAVFDHLGHVPAAYSVKDPGFQKLLHLMQDGLAWVKLSGTYRMTQSAGGPPYADVRPFFEAAIGMNPSQVVWATDWPHSALSHTPTPDDHDLADMTLDWIGADSALRSAIFVENPQRLYDFLPITD